MQRPCRFHFGLGVVTVARLKKLDDRALARRVAQELRPGEVIALGPGLPTLVPQDVPWSVSDVAGVLFLADSGALGYRVSASGPEAAAPEVVDSSGRAVALLPGGSVLSLIDAAALVRGRNADLAVVQPSQVSAAGDFTHWTTAATPGVSAPASAVDLAAGAGRMVAMMSHVSDEGTPNIVVQCAYPVDGLGCVALVVTDVAVMRVGDGGLVLAEVAPGWRADDVGAITGAPLTVASDLREITFDPPNLAAPNKVYADGLEAVRDLPHGATVMIDGFAGPGGMPHYLLVALRDHGARDLTMISNTAGIARVVGFGTPPGLQAIDHSILVDNMQVKKAIASYPASHSASRPSSFELAFQRGEVELELVPQGTLAERIRAGGAGVAAFYTPTGVGTMLAEGKENRIIGGREYVLEEALRADFCLIRGHKADTLGNVVYKGTSRNFNAVMAPAARVTVVEVDEIVEPGELAPEGIVTPGVYINRVVRRPEGFSAYE